MRNCEAFDLASYVSIQECSENDLKKARSLQKRSYLAKKIQDELNFVLEKKKKISLAHILKSTNEFCNYSEFLKKSTESPKAILFVRQENSEFKKKLILYWNKKEN